jgi:hypothetical protein
MAASYRMHQKQPLWVATQNPLPVLQIKVGLRRQIAQIQAISMDTLLAFFELDKYIGLLNADEFSVDISIGF